MTVPTAALALRVSLALALGGGVATAATPDPKLFAFPGGAANPASASAAWSALADRWLGGEPYDNAAFTAPRGFELSPEMLHNSRQDLSAANRNFSETGIYLDGSGAWIAMPLGRAAFFAYGSQPVLRREDNAFTRGVLAVDPQSPPAVIQSSTVARELRAGGGVSWGGPSLRAGIAAEWTRRDDRYEVHEQSGSPTAGTLTTAFSGDGVGGQAGLRFEHGASGSHPIVIGAGARLVPSLSLSATDVFLPETGGPPDTTAYSPSRSATWEGGLSARVGLSPAFALMAGGAGHGSQTWDGLGAASGAGASWAVAGAYHDPEEAWTVGFGFGQEQQNGAPEPRAGLFGLGFAWISEGTRLEVGALRRAIHREGSPTSYDDRIVATVGVEF